MIMMCAFENDIRYWDYICSTRIWALEHLREMKQLLDQSLSEQNGNGSASASAAASGPLPVSSTECFVKCKGQLFRGIFRECIAMESMGLIIKVDNPFCSWENRFMQRFRAFQYINNPPWLGYAEFLKIFQGKLPSAREILAPTATCFKNAKMLAEMARKLWAEKLENHQHHDDGAAGLEVVQRLESEQLMNIIKASVACSVGVMRAEQVLPPPLPAPSTSTSDAHCDGLSSADEVIMIMLSCVHDAIGG